ncbi:hypothetical protein B0H16DRAFT_1640570 [Mycena metata]|uniref:MYND-type domain-containing protein n=1 Tax=Mycena metata TaxID=1033252 RepID=A0AAD7GMI0_9AGAR|nr:hypothetical protein B0H16DRAFT_1640570 [Mycena metata]
MSPPVFESQMIYCEGSPTDIVPKICAIRICHLPDCKNYDDLHKCAQCGAAMYCSKTCQRADWARHKPYCKLITAYPAGVDGVEAPFHRHLRLWAGRFHASLISATIIALQLKKQPSNIDTLCLVIILHPRPHPEAGSRFSFVSAVVMPKEDVMKTFVEGHAKQALNAATAGPNALEVHEQERAERKASTGGMEDCAVVFLIAVNAGKHPLPGDEKGAFL